VPRSLEGVHPADSAAVAAEVLGFPSAAGSGSATISRTTYPSSSRRSDTSSTEGAGVTVPRGSTVVTSRVYCISDLHVDQHGGSNMQLLSRISTSRYTNDVLLVAGQ
jgi:hypothetical protein